VAERGEARNDKSGTGVLGTGWGSQALLAR